MNMAPNAQEIEQSLLGTVIDDRDKFSVVLSIITEEDFYNPAHAAIFNICKELYNFSDTFGILAIIDKARKKGMLDSIGGGLYLSDLTLKTAKGQSLKKLSRILKEKTKLRKIITLTSEINTQCYGDVDSSELIATLENELFSIAKEQDRNRNTHIKELYAAAIDVIEKRRESGIPPFIKTYIDDLDNIIDGIGMQDLFFIAGRPGSGKTTLAMKMAENLALVGKLKVLFFSLEMSKEELIERVLSSQSMISHGSIRDGSLNDYQMMQVIDTGDWLQEAGIYINDSTNLSVSQMQSIAQAHKIKHGLDIIIIDHIGLVKERTSDYRSDTRIKMVNKAGDLFNMKKRMKIPIVCLSQVGRPPKHVKIPPPPTMSDLKESGSLEENADKVILIHRPGAYDTNLADPNRTQIIVGKNRSGKTGVAELKFQPMFCTFSSYGWREK